MTEIPEIALDFLQAREDLSGEDNAGYHELSDEEQVAYAVQYVISNIDEFHEFRVGHLEEHHFSDYLQELCSTCRSVMDGSAWDGQCGNCADRTVTL